MSFRTSLNANSPTQLPDVGAAIAHGEILSFLLEKATPTDAGLVPAANVATLTGQPTAVFQVNATAGAVTGIKTLRKGPIAGDDSIVPASGECVWDLGVKILFAASDAVTAVSVTYAKSTDKASILEASF